MQNSATRILGTKLRATGNVVRVDADAYVVATVNRMMNDQEEYARLFAHAPALVLLLKHAVDEWPQFDDDEDVNGGDLVEWFARFRGHAKTLLSLSAGDELAALSPPDAARLPVAEPQNEEADDADA